MLNEWMNEFHNDKRFNSPKHMIIYNLYTPNISPNIYVKENLTDDREEKINLQLEWEVLIGLTGKNSSHFQYKMTTVCEWILSRQPSYSSPDVW